MKQLLFLFLLYSIPGVGQTTTTYYRDGYGGVPEKVGHSETRPTQSQFSSYIPAVDVNLYSEIHTGKLYIFTALIPESLLGGVILL